MSFTDKFICSYPVKECPAGSSAMLFTATVVSAAGRSTSSLGLWLPPPAPTSTNCKGGLDPSSTSMLHRGLLIWRAESDRRTNSDTDLRKNPSPFTVNNPAFMLLLKQKHIIIMMGTIFMLPWHRQGCLTVNLQQGRRQSWGWMEGAVTPRF